MKAHDSLVDGVHLGVKDVDLGVNLLLSSCELAQRRLDTGQRLVDLSDVLLIVHGLLMKPLHMVLRMELVVRGFYRGADRSRPSAWGCSVILIC